MDIILDVWPTAIEDNVVRQVINQYMDCLVSFLMPKPHHEGKYELIGTGFFIFSPDPTITLLMTARHVLEPFDFKVGRITVGTRMLALGDVGLRRLAPKADMAQWEIPSNLLLAEGISGVHALPVSKHDEADRNFQPTDSFILLGYPGSKNKKLDFRNGQQPNRDIFGLALHGSVLDAASGVREFGYNGKGRPEPWRSDMINPPTLDGMSGSPCFRIVLRRSSSEFAVVLAGVFYAWNKKTHRLSVASFGDPWAVEHPPLSGRWSFRLRP